MTDNLSIADHAFPWPMLTELSGMRNGGTVASIKTYQLLNGYDKREITFIWNFGKLSV